MTEETSTKQTRPDSGPRRVVVTNRHGLHARPCLAIVNTVGRHNASVTIQKDSQVVDASSIHALMSLAATQGTVLLLSATGPDAAAVVDALAYLFDTEFGISYQDVGG